MKHCSWVTVLSPRGNAVEWCGVNTGSVDHFCPAHRAIVRTLDAIKHLALLETAEAPR